MPILTEEGAAAVDEAIAALKNVAPAPALGSSDGLRFAADDHLRDLIAAGKRGHAGSDGSLLYDRSMPYGDWRGEIQKLVSSQIGDAQQIIFNRAIDDGVPGRGHRLALLNKNMRVGGIMSADGGARRMMCVVVLSRSFIQTS